jgi:hypothetical protein
MTGNTRGLFAPVRPHIERIGDTDTFTGPNHATSNDSG